MINHLLLKAVPKGGGGKEEKIFTLRKVDTNGIHGCEELKDLIKKHLIKDITDDFDVRYFEGSNILRIRSEEDLSEVWTKVQSNSKIIL